MRSLLVVGSGVKKKIVTSGDKVTQPVPFDRVKIELKCKVYQEGVMVYREKWNEADFICGLSGDTIHVQVLGVEDVLATGHHSDHNSSNSNSKNGSNNSKKGFSNPFLTCSYNGFELGETRMRERTLSAVWTNETFIIPIDDVFQLNQSENEIADYSAYKRYVLNTEYVLNTVYVLSAVNVLSAVCVLNTVYVLNAVYVLKTVGASVLTIAQFLLSLHFLSCSHMKSRPS